MRAIDMIVVHCTYSPPRMDIGVEEIRKWHVEGNKWTDIGYHFVIRRDGTIENGRSIERPGAHAKGYNSHSIAIAWVGGMAQGSEKAEDNRTDKQNEALYRLIKELQQEFPGAALAGHRDLKGVKKECPCFDVREWFAKQCSTEKKEAEQLPAQQQKRGALEKMALLSTTFKFILSITWKLYRHYRSTQRR